MLSLKSKLGVLVIRRYLWYTYLCQAEFLLRKVACFDIVFCARLLTDARLGSYSNQLIDGFLFAVKGSCQNESLYLRPNR